MSAWDGLTRNVILDERLPRERRAVSLDDLIATKDAYLSDKNKAEETLWRIFIFIGKKQGRGGGIRDEAWVKKLVAETLVELGNQDDAKRFLEQLNETVPVAPETESKTK